MDVVARLLLRDDIDALDQELLRAKQALNPDLAHIQRLTREIDRLEERHAAARRAEIERKCVGWASVENEPSSAHRLLRQLGAAKTDHPA